MLKNKFKYLAILVFPIVLVLPLPINISALTFALALLSLVVLSFLEPDRKSLRQLLKDPFILLCSFAFFIDLFTSLFRGIGFDSIFRESRIAFLILPIVFSLGRKSLAEIKDYLMLGFVLGVLLYILYAYGYLSYFYSSVSNRGFMLNHYLKYDLKTYVPYAYHHTYLGMYFCFAIVILHYYGFVKKQLNPKWVIGLILFIFLNQLYFGGKLTIAASFSILTFFVLKGYSKNLTKLSRNRLIVLVGLVSGFAVILMLFNKQGMLSTLGNSIDYRWDSWNCSLELVRQKIVFGWGRNNAIEALNQCITTGKNGTHNQILEELLYYGVFGLWILPFFYVLWSKLKTTSMGRMLILLLSVTCLSENIFSLQRGILFSLFLSALLYYTAFGSQHKFEHDGRIESDF